MYDIFLISYILAVHLNIIRSEVIFAYSDWNNDELSDTDGNSSDDEKVEKADARSI